MKREEEARSKLRDKGQNRSKGGREIGEDKKRTSRIVNQEAKEHRGWGRGRKKKKKGRI